MAPPRISEYGREHDAELVRLWRSAFEFGVGVNDPHAVEEQLAYLHEQVLPNNTVHLAWMGSTLAGFIACNQTSVAQLHVRVELHRRGIGSHLLNLAKAASAGSLWLYTFQQNLVARQFYEHHGFVPVLFGFEPAWQLADVKYRWVERQAVCCHAVGLAGGRVLKT